ncbi:MBL fold metallo-hydrolase [Lentibacillus salicampi]|uniref:MBL fold metallo-hydrolase n=1 Tax=Lentibacillus salicampi TaxID=175306 RepID=A0A4Y9AE06_9BACI|nr:MBL fold metallo-hydrolase [Lentibacillus salicampi]TFJ94129.1 MBL fold metallo-hydrolase [Lentibacillus salicampi]
MKVSVLGGGNEIGASCLHIQFDESSILIDAGMRMQGEDGLPMLGMLEELSKPDSILVTHAHADHIGALPVVHTLYPDVPVYATPPTADLMQLMMKDSYKILLEQSRANQALMPYTEEQMNQLLMDVRVLPANGVLKIGDLTITAYRAGHIVGAVMFMIEAGGERLLVTGDLSFRGGRTIPGAKVTEGTRPDVVVMESTYGNRLHTDRNTEEKRLAEHVAETVTNGGFALIPAFALGRAQEVLLILQDYMEKGLIPSFPIYVDGLVTPVSRIYRNYPHYLKGPVAHRIRTNGDAFLTEGRCIPVSAKERDTIIEGKPACIVASSGMLTGGASAWYAKHLVKDEKNAIYLTGYQDEESPGKKLLALAAGDESTIDIDGTSYDVNCRVDKFGLSAHADASEMTRFLETLDPTYTLLVHGDDDARTALEDKIHPRFHPVLTENGETYPFEKRKEGKGVTGKRYKRNREQERLRSYIGHVLLYQKDTDNTLKFGLCQNVHPKMATFYCDTPKGKLDKVASAMVLDTLGPWSLPIDDFSEAAKDVLTFSRPYLKNIDWDVLPDYIMSLQEIFQKLQVTDEAQQFAIALALQSIPDTQKHVDREGRSGYKLNKDITFQLSNLALPIQAVKMNANHAMDAVRDYFAGNTHFLKCGVKENGTENEYLLLSFDFPGSITKVDQRQITADIKQQTGWDAVISDSVRHEAFQPLLTSLMEQHVGMPSVHIQDGVVMTKEAKPENSRRIRDAFKQTTGFQLVFSEESSGVGVSDTYGEEALYMAGSDVAPMENNQAIAVAKQYGEDYGVSIYKTSMKNQSGQPLMELHFISPEVAARYSEMMQTLSKEIGMAVTYAKTPKQNEIIRITNEWLPDNWGQTGNPSVHMDKAEVSVKVAEKPDGDEFENARSGIEAETGYTLRLK